MNDSKISVRYAKAYYELSKEENFADNARTDMDLLLSFNEIADVKKLFVSPTISVTEKKTAVLAALKGKMHPRTLAFIELIIDNKRDSFIQAIALNVIKLYKTEKGIQTAILTTATGVNEKVTAQIKETIEQALKTKIELSQKVDTDIIGGFVLRIEDQQIDAGIKTALEKVKRSLINTKYQSKL